MVVLNEKNEQIAISIHNGSNVMIFSVSKKLKDLMPGIYYETYSGHDGKWRESVQNWIDETEERLELEDK